MDVLKAKRTYTAEFYGDSSGNYKVDCHTGHIHYRNKLKVGDGDDSTLRKLDCTLLWDEANRGWYFEFHSFHPWIPEYADDWIEFRDIFESKDQTIRYRPICQHVKGELIDNQVVYKDAFGNGIDLLVYPTRTQLMKVVRFNSKPTEVCYLDFEIEHPNKILLDVIKNDNERTHIKPLKIWDDNGHWLRIKYKFLFTDNKKILRKIIDPAELDDFDGKIYTDTTTSYYTSQGDGHVQCANKTGADRWNQVHVATTGTAYPSNANLYVQAYNDNTNANAARGFFPTSTADIPDTAVVTSAAFNLYVLSKATANTDAYDYVNIVGPTDQASYTTLASADFDNCGGATPVKWSSDVDISSVTTSAYLVFTVNATGLAQIPLTTELTGGYWPVGCREGHDIENVAPAPIQNNYLQIATSEATGTSTDPYLSVTYTVAPNAPTNCYISNITNTGCRVNWTDNSSDETGFKVYQDGVLIDTAAADATYYDVTGLTASTEYYFYVIATNASGDSAATNTVYMMTTGPGIHVQGRLGRLRGGQTPATVLDWADGIRFMRLKPNYITSAYTIDSARPDYFIRASGTFAVTIPSAANVTGRIMGIKNVGTGAITITPTGVLIEGGATWVLYAGEFVWFIYNGTSWDLL